MSATDLLLHHIQTRPDSIAFELGEESLTFGELETKARKWSQALVDRGIEPGDRVACHLPTSLEMMVVLLGNYHAGAIHVPINTRYGPVEIAHILADSGASLLVSSGESDLEAALGSAADLPRIQLRSEFDELMTLPGLMESRIRSDESTALLIYTSGTTGKSKGVELSFRAVVSNIDALTKLWRFSTEDTLLLSLPLFHVHGLCIGVHGTLLRGNRSRLRPRFAPEDVVAEFKKGASVFMGVPTMYSKLVEYLESARIEAEALESARLFTSGSAALSKNLFSRFEALTGHKILERYGMSETLLTLSNPYDGERRAGTVGMAVASGQAKVMNEGSECRPDEVGEIWVRGASIFSGYWNQPQQSEAAYTDGWFRTGDVATRSADGYISIVGRSSVDIIKSGGFKISAREIEEALETHEQVREVAVVGIPDPVWGQRISAAVVATKGSTPSQLLGSLQHFQREMLADYKTIRSICLVDELPRNALGKIQKHVLTDYAWTHT